MGLRASPAPGAGVETPPLRRGLVVAPLPTELRSSWLALLQESFGATRGTEAGLEEFWRRFPSPLPPETFAVHLSGEVLASITLREVDDGAARCGTLHLVAVRRAHRRRGLATALVAFALGELRHRGIARAMVGSENAAAIRIYRRAGFLPVSGAMEERA